MAGEVVHKWTGWGQLARNESREQLPSRGGSSICRARTAIPPIASVLWDNQHVSAPMGAGLRLLESVLLAIALVYTLLWSWTTAAQYPDLVSFITAELPFPLILPLLVAVLTILNVELLFSVLNRGNARETILTKRERQVGERLANTSSRINRWNSRWTWETEDEDRD